MCNEDAITPCETTVVGGCDTRSTSLHANFPPNNLAMLILDPSATTATLKPSTPSPTTTSVATKARTGPRPARR
jgi:hypothetical protein